MTINEATEQAYKKGYAKGIKDFAERLKEHTHDIVLYGQIVTVSRIDNLAEEMVGDGMPLPEPSKEGTNERSD